MTDQLELSLVFVRPRRETIAAHVLDAWRYGTRAGDYSAYHPWFYYLGGLPPDPVTIKARFISAEKASGKKGPTIAERMQAVREEIKRDVAEFMRLARGGVTAYSAMCWEQDLADKRMGWATALTLRAAHISSNKGKLRELARLAGYSVPAYEK